jgi:superfamily II DNA or RNA helicase
VSDLILHKINEVYFRVECEKHFAQELNEYFSFRPPNFQFNPKYKSRVWDGYIRLFSLKTFCLYSGLLPYVEKFCEEREYTLEIDKTLNVTENFSLVEGQQFVESLNLPSEIELREYQIKSFVHAIRNKRMLLLSPTGSGKSLMLYFITAFLQKNEYKKGLMIVPRIALCHQMYKDFESYGYNSEKNCHLIYQGQDKNTSKFLTISTWQSLQKMPLEYFQQFDFVLGDEAHEYEGKSLTSIMTNLINTKYRIGCTGTIKDAKSHRLVLEGLFGSVYSTTTTSELIEQKHLAELKIKCLVLKYPESICKEAKSWDYQQELDYIVSCTKRNEFIKNLALSLNGNTLILFQLVEKHGKELHRIIKEQTKNRHVFFVFGGTDVEVRESVRDITEREKNAIIVASYGTFSTGTNIKNLHNVIFASPSKSKIRNLQSIGRILRRSDTKDSATLFDIADDFRYNNKTNFTLRHFVERIKIYEEQKFYYKFYNIELKL